MGPRAVRGIAQVTEAPTVPTDPIAFLQRQTRRTVELVAKTRMVVDRNGEGYSQAIQTATREEEYRFIDQALHARGINGPAGEDAKARAHKEDLRTEDDMRMVAKSDVPKERLDELQAQAAQIKSMEMMAGIAAKKALAALPQPEREALVMALVDNDGLNAVLKHCPDDTRAVIEASKRGKGEKYDPSKEEKGIFDALTDPEFYETMGRLLPGTLARAGAGFVEGLGDVPLVGRLAKPLTAPLARGLRHGADALDGAFGADPIYENNPQAKMWNEVLAGGSGHLLAGAATAGLGELEMAGYVETTVETVEFLQGIEDLAGAYDRAKNVVDLCVGTLLPLQAALLRYFGGDRKGALEEISAALDAAIDVLANFLGEKTRPEKAAREKESRQQEHFQRRDRLDAAREAGGKSPYHTEQGAQQAYERDRKGEASPVAGKLDVRGWAKLADVLLEQIAAALKEALVALKNLLLSRLDKDPKTVDDQLAKEIATAGGAVVGNIFEAIADPIAKAAAQALDSHFIRPWLVKNAGYDVVDFSFADDFGDTRRGLRVCWNGLKRMRKQLQLIRYCCSDARPTKIERQNRLHRALAHCSSDGSLPIRFLIFSASCR